MRRLIAVALTLILAACADVQEPFVIIGTNGFFLQGTASDSLGGPGRFSATNGALTCSGVTGSLIEEEHVALSVICSDGRKGIAIANTDSGTGHLRLDDGTEADFVTGSAAASLIDTKADKH